MNLHFPGLFRVAVVLALAWVISSVPRLSAADLDAPPGGAFTIVVIPDTQGYTGVGTKKTPESTGPLINPVFQNHTRWIVENLKTQNIVFVSHVGDIVDRNNDAQWRLARECLDRLHGVVPYGLTVGNHDMDSSGDAALFQKYFPASRYTGFPWYGGSYTHDRPQQNISANNVNSHQLFSAGGLNFIHLNLECNAPDDVLAWAGALLDRYSNRRALISTHMDLGVLQKPKTEEGFVNDPTGRMQWVKVHGKRGNSPQQLWEKLYSRHANVDFIFSGDQSRITALTMESHGSVGNLVRALLSDYTSSGPLRLYRFIPSQNKVRVITFDTTTRQVVDTARYVPDRGAHQFELDYPMTPAAAKLR